MLKTIGVNRPPCRGAEHPEFNPLKINESRFPDGMRFKEMYYSQGVDSDHLTLEWTTQESYTKDDVDQFVAEVERAFRENKCTGRLTIEIQDRDCDCRPVKRTLTLREAKDATH